jgi:putative multiple sugar transport system substrate-binding protein
VLAVAAAGALAGCGSVGAGAAGADGAERPLVGVAMPTTTSERWIADGENVQDQLRALGYDVDLEYAENDVPTQVAQLEDMIAAGADALVIGSIDGVALKDVLAEAAAQEIPVIAYDRLIRESGDVDYYATFDNARVGVQQATTRRGSPPAPPARTGSSCSPGPRTTTTRPCSSTARCRCSGRTWTPAC